MTETSPQKEVKKPVFLASGEDARDLQDALADVLCWFQGFHAAKPDADLPAGLGTLRDLSIKLRIHF